MTPTTGSGGGTEAEQGGSTRHVEGGRGSNGWHQVTLALLGGLVAASFMFFLVAAVQTPGLDPPPETAALFVVVTTAGVVGYELLRAGSRAGYPAAMIAGGLVPVVLALVLAGTYGPAGPRTNPVGPVAYLVLAVGEVLAAGLAWRTGAGTRSSSVRRSTP